MESSLYARRLSAPSLYDQSTPFLAIPKPRLPISNSASQSFSLPNYYSASSPPTSPSSPGSHHPGSPNDGEAKRYSFVPLQGHTVKKRPRRRYDEIERLYKCSFQDCSKAYGTLNHLNAHVVMQGHGGRRSPSEFKELRRQWRKSKKETAEVGKAAEVAGLHHHSGHTQPHSASYYHHHSHSLDATTASHHGGHHHQLNTPHHNHYHHLPSPTESSSDSALSSSVHYLPHSHYQHSNNGGSGQHHHSGGSSYGAPSPSEYDCSLSDDSQPDGTGSDYWPSPGHPTNRLPLNNALLTTPLSGYQPSSQHDSYHGHSPSQQQLLPPLMSTVGGHAGSSCGPMSLGYRNEYYGGESPYENSQTYNEPRAITSDGHLYSQNSYRHC